MYEQDLNLTQYMNPNKLKRWTLATGRYKDVRSMCENVLSHVDFTSLDRLDDTNVRKERGQLSSCLSI